MGRKKNTILIAIVIVLIVILIALAGIAYCYFKTDLFKSNKQLFFEYMGQITNVENSIKQYIEKKENTPYTNEGEFTSNINNVNISFSGKTDKQENKTTQNITLNYSDEVNFPLNYKQIEETIGLQTKYVSSKHIAVETNNLENIIGNTEMTVELENIKIPEFNEEEVKYIQDTYINILNEQLKEEQFTKIEDTNYSGYTVKLTGTEIKSILNQLLVTLKDDEIILNKINEYLNVDDNMETVIEEYIEELENEEELDDEILTITVYQQNNLTNKITLETNSLKIDLKKVQEEDTLNYSISLLMLEENAELILTINYSGLNVMENVNETYKVEIKGIQEENEYDYVYQLNNNIIFEEEVNIEEFSEENAMMLIDYDTETVTNFLTSVMERIKTVNKNHMEELGVSENENPLIQWLLPFTGTLMQNEMQEIIEENENQIDLNSSEITTFNKKFQMYEGTNIQGTTVKGLLTTIARNNGINNDDDFIEEETTAEHLITEINFNGEEYKVNEQNIIFIKNELKLSEYYRVEFEMNEENGAIYRAVINEKVGQ